MLDYIHMLMDILPLMSVSSFMGYLKEKSVVTYIRKVDLAVRLI